MRTNYFKILALGLLGSLSVLSGTAVADEFLFKLHGVPLGQATFSYFDSTISDDQTRVSDEPATHQLAVKGSTRGAVSLFKEYSASFQSHQSRTGMRHYRVEALDGGVREIRHILFDPNLNTPPEVLDFADRTQAAPLAISDALDHDRIDPLHALQKMLTRINRDQTCEAHLAVYDGKRRYQVRVLPADAEAGALTPDLASNPSALKPEIKCRVILETESARPETVRSRDPIDRESLAKQEVVSEHNAKRVNKKPGFWPFNKTEQNMVVHFRDHAEGFRFEAFEITSPIGTIRGQRVDQDKSSRN